MIHERMVDGHSPCSQSSFDCGVMNTRLPSSSMRCSLARRIVGSMISLPLSTSSSVQYVREGAVLGDRHWGFLVESLQGSLAHYSTLHVPAKCASPLSLLIPVQKVYLPFRGHRLALQNRAAARNVPLTINLSRDLNLDFTSLQTLHITDTL